MSQLSSSRERTLRCPGNQSRSWWERFFAGYRKNENRLAARRHSILVLDNVDPKSHRTTSYMDHNDTPSRNRKVQGGLTIVSIFGTSIARECRAFSVFVTGQNLSHHDRL